MISEPPPNLLRLVAAVRFIIEKLVSLSFQILVEGVKVPQRMAYTMHSAFR
jgi:hypothetical protein